MRRMKAVELFAGIGGFRIACDANELRTIWANDICDKAFRVYEDRFGSGSMVAGDVRELLEAVPEHDVLTGGFPCQPFSAAGKKKGIRDIRGTLFQAIVDVLSNRQPEFFVLENVKRLLTMESGFHFATILASLASLNYCIEWRLLNAMHFGLPQNRQRVFIIGRKKESYGRIRLAESNEIAGMDADARERLSTGARWSRIEEHAERFPNWGLAVDGRFLGADIPFSNGKDIVLLKTVLESAPSSDFDFTESTLKWLKNNSPVNRFVQGVEILSNQSGGARMGYTIFGVEGVAPTLTSTTSRHYERYKIGDRYRRLTNVEYARIQGFPDDHCRAVSIYDQYALFGNAVPPPLATWAIQRALGEGFIHHEPARKKQRRLFDRAEQGRAEAAPA